MAFDSSHRNETICHFNWCCSHYSLFTFYRNSIAQIKLCFSWTEVDFKEVLSYGSAILDSLFYFESFVGTSCNVRPASRTVQRDLPIRISTRHKKKRRWDRESHPPLHFSPFGIWAATASHRMPNIEVCCSRFRSHWSVSFWSLKSPHLIFLNNWNSFSKGISKWKETKMDRPLFTARRRQNTKPKVWTIFFFMFIIWEYFVIC